MSETTITVEMTEDLILKMGRVLDERETLFAIIDIKNEQISNVLQQNEKLKLSLNDFVKVAEVELWGFARTGRQIVYKDAKKLLGELE